MRDHSLKSCWSYTLAQKGGNEATERGGEPTPTYFSFCKSAYREINIQVNRSIHFAKTGLDSDSYININTEILNNHNDPYLPWNSY